MAQFGDGLLHVGLVAAGILENTADGGVDLKQGQQHRLYRHKLVAHVLCVLHGLLKHFVAVVGEIGLSTCHAGQVLQLLLHEILNLCGVDTQLLEDEVGYVSAFLQDALEQMHRLDDLLASVLRGVDCFLYGFLRLDGEFVECHIDSFLVCCFYFLSSEAQMMCQKPIV